MKRIINTVKKAIEKTGNNPKVIKDKQSINHLGFTTFLILFQNFVLYM